MDRSFIWLQDIHNGELMSRLGWSIWNQFRNDNIWNEEGNLMDGKRSSFCYGTKTL